MSLISLLCRYNGRAVDPPPKFPSEMEEACEIVERIVNQEMRKRQRFKLEWNSSAAGDTDSLWRANVAASNCYQGGKESVGFHCDQLTYLGPYPTIASLSLGKDLNIFRYELKFMILLFRYSKEI
jgi:2OG-Fe(II) oxygenase superfamily